MGFYKEEEYVGGYEGGRGKEKEFHMIIVLFVLLIIVGSAFHKRY